MKTLFPQIYNSNQHSWTGFVDNSGDYYYNDSEKIKWNDNISENFDIIKNKTKENTFVNMTLNGEQVIAGYVPVKELDGYLIKIVSIQDNINGINSSRIIFIFCFIILFIILIYIFDRIVKIMLNQFHVITKTLQCVQKGDLSVRVPNCHDDEVGKIGAEINEMLSRITKLMEDSINSELMVKDFEIRSLQNQINAHFIYNVLESIKMMAEIDEKYTISDAVTSLGKLLRYSMKLMPKEVTISEEIDYIKNYLSLINLRFDYEINLSVSISDQIAKQKIPKMSLQPIVENAIFHGIENVAEDATVTIRGKIHDSDCDIEITDSGIGMTEQQIIYLQKKINGEIVSKGTSGNRIGLKNVQDRIKISFGENYGISVVSKKDCFTKIIVKIPYKPL